MLAHISLVLLPALAPIQGPNCVGLSPQILEGQPGPEGGQLTSAGPPFGATLSGGGRVAFISTIAGTTRNQAVMVASGTGLKAIAVGCGGAGGSGSPGACGDLAPGGGSFAGFFTFPGYAPATNEAGDVLFLADLFGNAPRALFLYRGATGLIERVAAVGAFSPSGAMITALGFGSLDRNGNAVFLARTLPSFGNANEILAYDAGVLSVVALEGGVGPGGTYALVANGLAMLPDNTVLLTGGVPSRDEFGRVAHFASVTPTQLSGLVLHVPGQSPSWIATFHQNSPAGGWFNTFGGPQIADSGEVVFSAQCMIGSNLATSVFAGVPGALRTVLAFQSPIGTSTVIGFERSANPFSFTGRAGAVVLWVRVQRQDSSLGEMHVLARPHVPPEVLAETGQTAVFGGVISELGHWPSIDPHGRVLHSALITSGPIANMAWVSVPCGIPLELCEGKPSSLGCTPKIGSIGRASATALTPFFVTAHSLPSQSLSLCFYGTMGIAPIPFQGGTLCIASPLARMPAQLSTGPSPSACSGTLAVDFGARIASGIDTALQIGAPVAMQWFIRDPADPTGFGSTMSDALALTIGP